MSSVSAMRTKLKLNKQFEELAADVRCLAEALETQPAVPPRGKPVEAVPLAMASRSDCHWPNFSPSEVHVKTGLTTKEVLTHEEKTFKLLAALDGGSKQSGPLTSTMLAAATPPPHKPRPENVRIYVAPKQQQQQSSSGAAEVAAATAARSAALAGPPIDDTDLQPNVMYGDQQQKPQSPPPSAFEPPQTQTQQTASYETARSPKRYGD